MIADLEEALRKKLKAQKVYPASYTIEKQLISLLILKYLCEQNKESYSQLIKKGILEKWTYQIDELTIIVSNLHTSLLALIQYENLEDLVREYLDTKKLEPNIFNKDAKKLAICSHFSKKTYDILGNTTYIIDKLNPSTRGIFYFKFFDLVLGNNNQYLKYDKIDFNDYNYLYVYDYNAKFNFIRNNENDALDLIWHILWHNSHLEIVLDTNYSKIAVMKNASFMLHNITKIILCNDDTVYIYFHKLAKDKISIINWQNQSLEKLEQIIKLNRQQKDVLVKVTPEEIKENNYRIGFKLYQTEIKEENKSINELVDENTKLVNKLASINKNIELELNKLINR